MISNKIAIAVMAVVTSTALASTAHAQARDQIRIVGSSTVFPFTTAVAENFGRDTDFKTPVVESTGSGGGLRLFCAGVGPQHPDITNASRKIKTSEIELCASNGVAEITEVTVGYDGIVIANSKQSELSDYTKGQLFTALADTVLIDGELETNPYETWDEIDPSLPAKDIEVLGPPPTSGTRDAFVELVMEEGCDDVGAEAAAEAAGIDPDEVCARVREDGMFVEAGENDNLIVQKLVANPDAYGIFGFSFLDQNSDTLQGSLIAGVEPTFDNIASGDYGVSRSLYFYVKNAHVGVIPGIREFLAEYTAERAWGPDGYLADKGLIPLPDDMRGAARTNAVNLSPM